MKTLITTLLAVVGSAAFAQTTATDPWVRAAVPGQKATGMFVQLRSKGYAPRGREHARWPASPRSTR